MFEITPTSLPCFTSHPVYQIGQLEGKPELTTADEKRKASTGGTDLPKSQPQSVAKLELGFCLWIPEPFSQKRDYLRCVLLLSLCLHSNKLELLVHRGKNIFK